MTSQARHSFGKLKLSSSQTLLITQCPLIQEEEYKNNTKNETNDKTITLHTHIGPVNPRLHRRDRQEQPLHLHR